MRRISILVVILLACVASAQQAHPAKSAASPSSELNSGAERIRAHVKFLSSDLLEGRGTGQRGGDIAAEYLAAQFEAYGLKPAGDHGTYMQRVPMVGITTSEGTSVAIEPKSGAAMQLAMADDVVAMDETQNAADDVNAPIVFVGYGISAPEYKW